MRPRRIAPGRPTATTAIRSRQSDPRVTPEGGLYIPTGEGWLYLAAILDMHTHKIVGWSMRPALHTEIALDALNMAVECQRPATGLIHHSDRGIQYAAEAYRSPLARSGITPSMSRKGRLLGSSYRRRRRSSPMARAPMESFFRPLKTERVHHRVYATRDQAGRDLFGYIEGFYTRRLHSSLGYISPAEAERERLNPFTFGGEDQGYRIALGQSSSTLALRFGTRTIGAPYPTQS